MNAIEQLKNGEIPWRNNLLDTQALPTFESSRMPTGEDFGVMVSTSALPIICFADESNTAAAHIAGELLAIKPDRLWVTKEKDPLATAMTIKEPVIPLVVTSAIDPTLKDMLFGQATFGELLADSFPVRSDKKDTGPLLHCIGITRHGIDLLLKEQPVNNGQEINQREIRTQHMLGDIVGPQAFREILISDSIREVHIHALGPAGTNISQAARLYAQRLGIDKKTNIVVHPAGVTPMTYAEIAKEKTKNSPRDVLHLHMECAVYNNMGKLFQERSDEFVFADTQHMALDVMQLASNRSMDELRVQARTQQPIRIATHPSPAPLVAPWIQEGSVTWVEASSNSAAAIMVKRGDADACVTTASTVELMKKDHMQTLHAFGSPNMIFTIASALAPAQLHALHKEVR